MISKRRRAGLARRPPRLPKRLGRTVAGECCKDDGSGCLGIGPPGGMNDKWTGAGTGSHPVADELALEHER
jgi:hypothetical protein